MRRVFIYFKGLTIIYVASSTYLDTIRIIKFCVWKIHFVERSDPNGISWQVFFLFYRSRLRSFTSRKRKHEWLKLLLESPRWHTRSNKKIPRLIPVHHDLNAFTLLHKRMCHNGIRLRMQLFSLLKVSRLNEVHCMHYSAFLWIKMQWFLFLYVVHYLSWEYDALLRLQAQSIRKVPYLMSWIKSVLSLHCWITALLGSNL